MAHLSFVLISIAAFLVVLTILVFVHELGHYLSARRHGVKIEVFSIGFGREIFGFNDKSGTRWKFSAIPLGGYVKMFGDANAASQPGDEVAEMTRGGEGGLLPSQETLSARRDRRRRARSPISCSPSWSSFSCSRPSAIRSRRPSSARSCRAARLPRPDLEPGDRILSVDGQPVFRFRDLGDRDPRRRWRGGGADGAPFRRRGRRSG